MFSTEQRRIAIETFIRFDHSHADAIAEPGYPTRHSPRAWYKDYLGHGEVRPPKRRREPKLALEMRQAAVDYYLAHGKSPAGTMRRMGHPASREYLCGWIDELAPGQGKYRGPSPKAGPVPLAERMQAVAEPGSRGGTAAEVAEKHGAPRTAPHVWRREMTGDDGGGPETRGGPAGKEFDDPPDDIEVLRDMLREAKMQLRKVQLGLDVRQATLEMVKKDQGADPEPLTSEEKAAMVEAPRAEHRLCEILPVVGMAKSSYEYARNAQVNADAGDGAAIGGRTVRDIMRDEGLVACAARKKRRYSSYEGEISEAPENLLRDERGGHHFHADKPNELRVADVTEFRIPAGKACLPPIVDCSGGMPLSWSISTSPDAEMANSSLLGACKRLGEGGHPKIHSDRGCHYRWPGWIGICDENGLARSMSRKGCSPDDARCEGFFGRLKIEFFHGCDWAGVTLGEFMDMLDAYLRWYGDVRIKGDLDYRSPMQYRRDLGLLAA